MISLKEVFSDSFSCTFPLQGTVTKLVSLRETFQSARMLLKFVGEQAGVEIEPENQTALLEATLLLPGVLTAGIPGLHYSFPLSLVSRLFETVGAGGQDAIFVLTLSSEAREKVEDLWSRWHEYGHNTVCALTLRAGEEKDFGIQFNLL